MRKKSKLKLQTKGKSYPLCDSPFYKLRTKKKLAELIGFPLIELQKLRSHIGHYIEFEEEGKKGKKRKIQQPINEMDRVHTRIASLICRIDVPNYLHSGRKGFSNVSNAKAHLDSSKLMATDVKSFFPSTTRRMIFSFFYSVMQCSPDVSDILADICTIHGHLPTGSRISMPIAFWASCRLFEELDSLSKHHDVKMTLYVDDLTFSGANVNRLFKTTVRKIIERHGHTMHPTKTKLYDEHQPKLITGVVVDNGVLRVRNQQRKQLITDFACWDLVKDVENASLLPCTNSLIGRLQSMGMIDGAFKERAKTVRGQTHK
ncbi:reverse transcriptase family protein [Vibrio europaeus]|uniref:reverse transcriptase family protein n=1 Tax=Vibrio europaeus TaxID=300876 RepID=UPI00148CD475|nr:reverse transcriptase family protein [Vibrio europaeus]NOH25695.1 RNA-directed DNA polymerase [Vibrio europaeus]